jgi:hypothetical protein
LRIRRKLANITKSGPKMEWPASKRLWNYFVGELLFWSSAAWAMQGGNLRADYRILWSFVDIDLRPVSIVFGHVVIGKDCFHRTLRHACITIDAGVSVNVETVRQFVKCFDRAHRGTVGIFAVNT